MSEMICPHCKNTIYDEEALLCHFCGNSLGRTSGGALGAMRGAGMKWALVAMVIIIILLVIIYRMRKYAVYH